MDASARDLELIGVIGSGQMGAGIAHVCAVAGLDVMLVDTTLERATAGRATVEKLLGKQVEKGKLSAAERDATMGRIRPVSSIEELGAASVVVEAATEDRDLKIALFKKADDAMRRDAILASNTSM